MVSVHSRHKTIVRLLRSKRNSAFDRAYLQLNTPIHMIKGNQIDNIRKIGLKPYTLPIYKSGNIC